MDNKTHSDGILPTFLDLEKGYELRSKLSDVSIGLQLYEKISVVFLLCKNSQAGLEIMKSMLEKPDKKTQNNLFYKWMKKQTLFINNDWREHFAEVLTIIQNYKLGKVLGFTKEEMIERFLPGNNLKSFFVSIVKKVLYNLCEELNQDETSKLVTLIEDVSDTTITVINKPKNYLETCLLFWSEKNIINIEEDEKNDLNILLYCLKSLNCNNSIHTIEVAVEKYNYHVIKSKSYISLDNPLVYYEVNNEDNIGLCVIISEKNFSNGLPKRWGTEKDVQRLVEVFTAFGFDIKIHTDLGHEEFLSTLEYYAKSVDSNISFFILIILSHGSENVIYTSNSMPVDMNTIEMIFQAEVCPHLIGKPKIFIVQSCQGEKWQKALVKDDPSDIEADNFVYQISRQPSAIGPQRGDSMIAWSTVQGFASFRDKHNGSWYIQELCKELWKYGNSFDLVEIFTRVNNNLRTKVFNGQFMVPSLLLSLRANVKFPLIKNNLIRGKLMMLERLLFEKYFKEFLLQNGSAKLETLIKSVR